MNYFPCFKEYKTIKRALSKISHFFRLVCWNVYVYSSRKIPCLKRKKTVPTGTVISTARTDILLVEYPRNRSSSSRSAVLLCAPVFICFYGCKSVTSFRLFFGMYTYLSKTVPPGTVVQTAKTDILVVEYALNRSSSHSPMLLCACVCVSLSLWMLSKSVTSFRLFVCWNMYPFVQNTAGKKTVSPGTVIWTARTDIPVVQYARNRSSSRSPVFCCVCASLSVCVSVWCVWAAAFVVTLFDIGLLWSLTFFCCEVHYIRGKFLEAFELRFS